MDLLENTGRTFDAAFQSRLSALFRADELRDKAIDHALASEAGSENQRKLRCFESRSATVLVGPGLKVGKSIDFDPMLAAATVKDWKTTRANGRFKERSKNNSAQSHICLSVL